MSLQNLFILLCYIYSNVTWLTGVPRSHDHAFLKMAKQLVRLHFLHKQLN